MSVSLKRKVKKDAIPLSSARRKELKKRAAELSDNGLVLSDIRMETAPNRFFLCLVRAVLIFLAVLGTIGGLVSAFDLPFSLPIVIVGFFVLAFLSAFLYYSKLSFYAGYVLVFVGFIFFSLRFYFYINSGYQAFMNEVYNRYSDFFNLLSLREATEFIENRYLTVTAAMLFMGWFFSILLNITISGYMNLAETFLLTFLPLQVAFYIDIVPPTPYLILLLAVYIAVAVLQRSGNYSLPFRHAKEQHFDRRRSRRGTSHVYLASSRGMLRIAVGAGLLSTVFLLLTGALFSTDFSTRFVSNPVKDSTDSYVQAVVQNGLASLLNRYRATGGLAHGRLGGIGNVSPDFETDLTIRYVPYTADGLYLKAFTGVTYRDNTFLPYYTGTEPESGESRSVTALEIAQSERYIPIVTGHNDDTVRTAEEFAPLYSKLWINNIDADTAYDYRPYYSYASTTGHSVVESGFSDQLSAYAAEHFADSYALLDDEPTLRSYTENPGQQLYEVLYLPYINRLRYAPNPTVTQDYEDFVYDIYLQVPENTFEALDDFWDEPELAEELASARAALETRLSAAATPEERYYAQQQYRLALASALKFYFVRNFRYTMSPGVTPWNQDVVSYFLSVQRRGYCAHYASSATLLLRRMGIPTRYIEGYMISVTEIAEGRALSNDVEGWQLGESELDTSAIVEVDITDASAHAWIEIYLDGYGWIPYEMTPPSEETVDPAGSNNDFFRFLTRLFTPTERNTDGSAAEANITAQALGSRRFLGALSGFAYLLRPLAWMVALFFAILLLIPVWRRLTIRLRIRKLLREGHTSAALLLHYRPLTDALRQRRLLPVKNAGIRDVFTLLPTLLSSPALAARFQEAAHTTDPEHLADTLWYAAYSGGELSAEEYAAARSQLALLTALIKKLRRRALPSGSGTPRRSAARSH